MVPRHFWWLVEAIEGEGRSAKPGATLSSDDWRDLLALLENAENGML